jgi:hypothetical protein
MRVGDRGKQVTIGSLSTSNGTILIAMEFLEIRPSGIVD